MLYANNLNENNKILAKPKLVGYCPSCKAKLIPKCGEINVWHWSHKGLVNCDSWYECESSWHLGWKKLVKPNNCEVQIKKEYYENDFDSYKTCKTHIADIVGKNKVVIELQNSPISVDDIRKRELFYKKMFWIFNAENFKKNIDFRYKKDYVTFRWKHPRKSMFHIKCPMYWDFNDDTLFLVSNVYNHIPCGGWGKFIKKEDFIKKFLEVDNGQRIN